MIVCRAVKTKIEFPVKSNIGNNVYKRNQKFGNKADGNIQGNATITGYVRDIKSGEPVIGASILNLEQNTGVIIIITSNHAFSTIPGCFPYNVSKTALTGLVRSLAIEWGPRIRTVGLAPGFIDTPGNQQWFNSFPNPEKERQRTIDLHPVKKLGTPEEAGAWCVFLASDYAAFASGTTYLLDGGRSALMQDS